jgi:hypothetical protein
MLGKSSFPRNKGTETSWIGPDGAGPSRNARNKSKRTDRNSMTNCSKRPEGRPDGIVHPIYQDQLAILIAASEKET